MDGGRVLLIDNVDSFTFNVADLLHRVMGRAPVVWTHDHQAGVADLSQFAAIVVGPGPGRPQHAADMGLSAQALQQRSVPVLGVCLGHQGLAYLAGDVVTEMRRPRHGVVSLVDHDGIGPLAAVPSPFRAVRYHSLEVVLGPDSSLRAVAWAADDRSVMALVDDASAVPRWGVQFHPESVLTEHGEQIVGNFLAAAGVPCSTVTADAGPVAVGDVQQAHRHPPSQEAVRVGEHRIDGPVDASEVHRLLTAEADRSVWLDSAIGDGRGEQSRFSVVAVGGGPLSHEQVHRVGDGMFLEELRGELDRWRVEDDAIGVPFDVRPGFFGYLGYELKSETTAVPASRYRSQHPDAWMMFADRIVVIDHLLHRTHLLWLSTASTARQQQQWVNRAIEWVGQAGMAQAPPDAPAGGVRGATSAEPSWTGGLRHDRDTYLELIRRCQQQIVRGESYEICLTNTVHWPTPVETRQLYQTLRSVSPAPFGAWLRAGGVEVLSASPERFVRVSSDAAVQARPIKGTRPRAGDPEADAALAAELASSVKDRAENLMIVDLLRNDLHRVCASGSVEVPSLFAVEPHAGVHQMVSTITGRLAEGMGPVDVLTSCFPGGSMTGAPKVRTMEILEDLEGGPRGVYSGAIGWISVTGAMDSAIVIRTITVADGRASFGIGGAITALSDPDDEFAETLHKASGVVAALESSGRDAR